LRRALAVVLTVLAGGCAVGEDAGRPGPDPARATLALVGGRVRDVRALARVRYTLGGGRVIFQTGRR
jgi:hypothetical protein